MKVLYNGNYKQIHSAVEDANELYDSEIFYENIARHPGFSCSKKAPKEIAQIMKESYLEIEVKLYRPKWKRSKVLGYFIRSYPTTIFLNSRKIYRETNSITNTIVHECVHALDNSLNSKIIEFGHNCGYFKNTAPYEIGNIAESIIDGGIIESIEMPPDTFETIELDRII